MDGQFLVRQIYDDQITYNLVGAAVEILSEYPSDDIFYVEQEQNFIFIST